MKKDLFLLINRAMRITIFLTLACVVNVCAKSYSQERLTLSLKEVKLSRVFHVIQHQTNYQFIYSNEDIQDAPLVSVIVKGATVPQILALCFTDNYPLEYRIEDSTVIVLRRPLVPQAMKLPAEIAIPQFTVHGKVTDSLGNPLVGVSVSLKGTSIGTVTDANGDYSLTLESGEGTLVFSYVGWARKERAINGQSGVNVVLNAEATGLDQVVIIGYGEANKITYTGSVSQVKGDNLKRIPTADVGNSLTGRVPGLTTIQTTGQPGMSEPEIYIRGISTFNGTSPLVIIDGVPGTLKELQHLNTSSIEDISVLKDASATAVYGIRGANGVIIVTTKLGNAGKMKISADIDFAVQVPKRTYKRANGYQIVQAINKGYINDGDSSSVLPDDFVKDYKTGGNPLVHPDIVWWDELLKPALQTKANLTVSGGDEKAQYFVAFGYLKRDGILKSHSDLLKGGPGRIFNFNSERFNITANINYNITSSTKLSLKNKAIIRGRREPVSGGITPHDFWGRTAEHSGPFYTAGVVDGKYIESNQDYFPFLVEDALVNKVYGTGFRKIENNLYDIHLRLSQQFLKSFEFDIEGSYKSGFTRNQDYYKGIVTYTPFYLTNVRNKNRIPGDSTVVLQKNGSDVRSGSWSGNYAVSRRLYLQATLRYKQTFGNHNLSALLLYNQGKDYYPDPDRGYSNIPTGYVGSAGRVSYDYDDKYLFEFDMAYNGSENFKKNRRFGFFPAVSMGWVLSKEEFINNIDFIDFLKLKFSIGKVGSDQIGGSRFIYLPSVYEQTSAIYQGYNFGEQNPAQMLGTRVGSVGNPEVSWETAVKKNFGLEATLFNGLDLEFNYFTEMRENILMYRKSTPVFVTATAPQPPYNIGRVKNHGFEIQLGFNHRNSKGFSYNISANGSYSKNKILFEDEIPPVEPYMSSTGNPLNTTFGYIVEGFYNKDNLNSSKIPKIDFSGEPKPGDLIYKDLNGDGIIDYRDVKPIGYPRVPQITYGLQMNFDIKGFSLKMNMMGVGQVSRSISGSLRRPVLVEGRGVFEWYLDKTWTAERAQNDIDGLVPRLSVGGSGDANYVTSTMWLRNASYFRLKNAEIGYTFDAESLTGLGLGGVERIYVYLSGYNLFTLKSSGMKHLDPEKDLGEDNNHYPLLRIFNLGLSIDF